MSIKKIFALAKTLVVSATTICFATIGVEQAALSMSFTFTNIADSNSQFSFVGNNPVINEQGTVAFSADLISGGSGIFTNNGGAITTTIADNKGIFSSFGSYALNDHGTVAFTADLKGLNLQTGGRGLFTGNGGAINKIADTNGEIKNFYEPAINNNGTVAFGGTRDGGNLGIFAFKNNSIITISDQGTRWASINNRGTVAYGAFLPNDNLSIFTGDGGAVTRIADSTGPLKNLQIPAINNSGIVAFNASFDTGGNGIFESIDGVINNVADTSGAFNIVRAVSINDHDAIVFGADLKAGGEGIFTGANPVTDKVITTGDLLFGSKVTQLFAFSNKFLNNSGQIAFHAQLADGRTVIARAEPISAVPPTTIPEPNFLLGLVLLSFLGILKAPNRRCNIKQ